MAANLKLVADSSWFQQNTAEVVSLPMPRDLQISAGTAAEMKRAATSYAMLGLVLAMHAMVLVSALMTKPDAEMVKLQSMPMTVSLLSAPSAEKPLPPQPKVQPEPQPKPVEVKRRKHAPVPHIKQPADAAVKEPIVSKPVATEPVEQHKPTESHVAENVVKPEHAVSAAEAPARVEAAVEEVIEPPRFGAAYLNNPPPIYPSLSRRVGEQGRVLLKVLVSESGHAESVQIDTSSGFDKLDRAAIEAVKKWSFIPAKLSNQPISAFVLVPIKFSLNS